MHSLLSVLRLSDVRYELMAKSEASGARNVLLFNRSVATCAPTLGQSYHYAGHDDLFVNTLRLNFILQ